MGHGHWVMGGVLVVSLKNNSGNKVIMIIQKKATDKYIIFVHITLIINTI